MQAIVYDHYGPPDVLKLTELDRPVPTADQILISIRCASVNPYDWHFLRGNPNFIRIFTGLLRPKSPRLGADFAGDVVAVGPPGARFRVGDRVFGTCRGAFAQFGCGSEKDLALIPSGVTYEQAASLPIAGVTALQGLRDSARLQRGQSILINGAAGGVGTFAVQLARYMGANVTGVCSTRNLDLVLSLGAHAAIDYIHNDFTDGGPRYDVIFDLVGNRSLSELRRVLKPKGVLVPCGAGGPDRSSLGLLASMISHSLIAPFISHRVAGIFAKINAADLEQLASLVEAGHIVPVLDRTFALAETTAAIRYLEKGHARGKVILNIS